jgi:RNA polymerase sigma factor (sigma-70 family)
MFTTNDSATETTEGSHSTGTTRATRARMTAEEEVQLAREWRDTGSPAARERLVTANLGLVVSIAQRYRNGGVPLEELIAEGNLGLLSAVDGFDPECGSRFSTYAAYWIRQGISRAFAANSPRGRLSGRDRRDLSELERASRRHYSQSGDMPTIAELSEELGWSTERVNACKAMFVAYSKPHSLDQPSQERPGAGPAAATEGAFPLEKNEACAEVDRLLSGLSPLERSAIELRFGLHGAEPQNIHAIAKSLDHSKPETRAALRAAMAKLLRSGRTWRTQQSGNAVAGDGLSQSGYFDHFSGES